MYACYQDLERVGEDIVASLLEVVDMEEGLREEDSSYEEPVATDDNQVVPSLVCFPLNVILEIIF